MLMNAPNGMPVRATGLRSVYWHPVATSLWFNENGRAWVTNIHLFQVSFNQ